MNAKTVTAQVSKDWKLGEVIKKYPSSMELLHNYGFKVHGCSIPDWLSLEEFASENGIESRKVEEMVKEINAQIRENEKNMDGLVNLTVKAAEKVKELIEKEHRAGQGIKIGVTPGGCAGFSYAMDFQEKAGAEEEVVESHGIPLFVAKSHKSFVQGMKIDFVETLQGAGFKISNPNAKSTCSCGQSFS